MKLIIDQKSSFDVALFHHMWEKVQSFRTCKHEKLNRKYDEKIDCMTENFAVGSVARQTQEVNEIFIKFNFEDFNKQSNHENIPKNFKCCRRYHVNFGSFTTVQQFPAAPFVPILLRYRFYSETHNFPTWMKKGNENDVFQRFTTIP